MNQIITILEDDERLHALEALRELAEAEERPIAANALRVFVVDPIRAWIGDNPDSARSDFAAGHELADYADELAERFSGNRMILPEYFERLDELWSKFQRAAGYGAAAVVVRDESKLLNWRAAGGRARKGKLSPFNQAVHALAKALRTRDAGKILDEMRADAHDESDLLDDLRARPENPVTLRFQEVPDATDEAARIDFVHTDTGREESRTVKTLKNNLSKLPDMLPMSG
jgi:hypothetical protein